MKETTQKEKVLKNIRSALVTAMDAPFPDLDMDQDVFYHPSGESLDIVFAESFSKVNGKFIYCANADELSSALLGLLRERNIRSLFCGEDFFEGLLEEFGISCFYDTNEIARCDASLTSCEVLISRTGTILMSSRQGSGRKGGIYAPVHIVIASSKQIVPGIKDAFQYLYRRYGASWPSMLSFITGPSRSSAVEWKTVYGAIGPSDLFLFLLDASGVDNKMEDHG